jgi:hypothetical protein
MVSAIGQPTTFAGEHIQHHRQVEDSLQRFDIGQVGDPQRVRRSGGEIPLDQIGSRVALLSCRVVFQCLCR